MGTVTYETCALWGMTLAEAARTRGVGYKSAQVYAKAHGLRFRPAWVSPQDWDADMPPEKRVTRDRNAADRAADEAVLARLRAVAVDGLTASEAARRTGATDRRDPRCGLRDAVQGPQG